MTHFRCFEESGNSDLLEHLFAQLAMDVGWITTLVSEEYQERTPESTLAAYVTDAFNAMATRRWSRFKYGQESQSQEHRRENYRFARFWYSVEDAVKAIIARVPHCSTCGVRLSFHHQCQGCIGRASPEPRDNLEPPDD